jgi:hypothetical protein
VKCKEEMKKKKKKKKKKRKKTKEEMLKLEVGTDCLLLLFLLTPPGPLSPSVSLYYSH